MIRKRGSTFVLESSTGKVLGTHRSKKKAMAQERAIKASQSRQRNARRGR